MPASPFGSSVSSLSATLSTAKSWGRPISSGSALSLLPLRLSVSSRDSSAKFSATSSRALRSASSVVREVSTDRGPRLARRLSLTSTTSSFLSVAREAGSAVRQLRCASRYFSSPRHASVSGRAAREQPLTMSVCRLARCPTRGDRATRP